MSTVKLSARIDKEGNLILQDTHVDLPEGPVEVVVYSKMSTQKLTEREKIRQQLHLSDFLVTDLTAPENYIPFTSEERLRIGTPIKVTSSTLEMIQTDRGDH